MSWGHRQAGRSFPAGGGFTLIELLVVVGVMAILIGILMPVLASARRSARMATCASNMRQIGQALEMYQLENRQIYPYAAFQRVTTSSNSEITFDDLLHRHLGGVALSQGEMDANVSPKPIRIWQCPEDDRERWFGHPARTYVPTCTRIRNLSGTPQPGVTRMFTGFAGSEASNGGGPLFRLSIKPSELHRTSEYITFVEYPAASNWQGSGLRSSCAGPEQQSWFMPRGRTLHRTKWNYLFADGHVAAHDAYDTPDPQFCSSLKQLMLTMTLYNAETQPATLPQYRVPFVPIGGQGDYNVSADTWWGGMWAGHAKPPKGAQLPRDEKINRE